MNFDRYKLVGTGPIRSTYKDDAAYRRALVDWHGRKLSLVDKFKADALAAVGLDGHPKADAAFDKAWSEGHAFGYNEVFKELRELADLILPDEEVA